MTVRQVCIAIPTYNRPLELDLLLTSIAVQRFQFAERVKVLVSDNASSSDVASIIKKFRLLIPELEYVRNQKNIGPDRNIANCFIWGRSFGAYTWVVGDDEVLLPGSIAEIIKIIDLTSPNAIYVNGCPDNAPLREWLRSPRLVSKPNLFVQLTNIYLTFISGMVINSERVDDSVLKTIELSKGSNLVQLCWVFAAINAEGGALVYFPKFSLIAKTNNSSGYSVAKVFSGNLKSIMRATLSIPSFQSRTLELAAIITFFPQYIRPSKLENSKFDDNREIAMSELKLHFGNYWEFKMFLQPIMTWPVFPSTLVYYVTRVLARLEIALRNVQLVTRCRIIKLKT